MAGRLDGKIAVVTGAGSGMGRAMAELFAREGARVICADISGNELSVADGIGDAAIAISVDVSRSEDVQRMIALAEDRFGRLDVLCNNAGIAAPQQRLHEVEDEFFDRIYAINLRGVFLGVKYGIRSMLKSGGGSIVNTASAAGLVAWELNGAYGPSKAGVIQLTRNAAVEYARDNIRINALCPGLTWTGMASGSNTLEAPPEGTPVPPGTPMGRWSVPQEMATAALFLASDDASYVTGIAMPVDGGFTAA